MTDRELLEKAAKAAGLEPFTAWGRMFVMGDDGSPPKAEWNPIANDDDAFRLAVKLYLWEPIRLAHRGVSKDVDIYAATRRAIVRAAAAMAGAA